MEWLIKLLNFLANNPGVALFGAVTLIEIAPIKINPWKWLLKWIGNAVNAEDRKNIQDIKDEVSKLSKTVDEMKEEQEQEKKDREQDKASDKRWRILDFINSSRHGRTHTREEWNHTLSELAEYEQFCEVRDIPNGVIDEGAKYLRDLYQENCRNNNFL